MLALSLTVLLVSLTAILIIESVDLYRTVDLLLALDPEAEVNGASKFIHKSIKGLK